MRAELGIAGLSAGLWLAGTAILLACGVVSRSWRSLAAWSGPAYLVGSAAVGLALTIGVVAGIRLSSATTAIVVVLVVVAGAVAARVLRVPALPRLALPRDRAFVVVGAVVAALFLVFGTRVALVQPINDWDGWAIWGLKSLLIYDHGTIPAQFATGDYTVTHLDYPMFWPVHEATYYRAMGGPQHQLATLPHWLLYVSFAWTVAAVGARLTRPAVWVTAALGTLTTYAILDQLFWHYADVPTAILAAGGALFGGLWVSGRGERWLVPCALLLGAAANGKNEGLTAAVALAVALVAAALVVRRRRAVVAAVGVAVAVGLAALPWRLWMAAHDVEGDIKASRALDPGALADSSSRVEPAASALWDNVTATDRWGSIAFVALVLIAVGVWRRPTRALGTYYAVVAALVFLSLLFAYWVAETDLTWHLKTSADRVVQLLGFLGIAVALQLGAALYDDGREPQSRAGP